MRNTELKKWLNANRLKDGAPILNTALVQAGPGGAVITRTDLEITTRLYVPGEYPETTYLLDCEKASKALSVKGAEFNVIAGMIGLINCQSPIQVDEFPAMVNVVFPEDQTWRPIGNAQALVGELLKVMPASDCMEGRFTLNGAFIGDGQTTATDGHCLLTVKSKVFYPEGFKGMIIPKECVKALALLNDPVAGVFYGENCRYLGFLDQDGRAVTIKEIDGEYPDYRRACPDHNPIHVQLESSAMIDAIKAIAPIQDKKNPSMALTLNGKVCIERQDVSIQIGTENPGCEFMKIGLDPNILTVGLEAEPSYIWEFENELNPIMARSGDTEFVIMPMKL